MKGSLSIRSASKRSGFTLIEMIGVLAIIAILIAAVSPRIFDAISDAKITGAASMIKTMQSSVVKYYTDVGTLFPLSNVGVPAANAAGTLLPNILTGITAVPNPPQGLWLKFKGPYLEKYNGANPPVGTSMIMPCVNAVAGNAANNNVTNYDLNNDGVGDFPATNQLASLQFAGVSQKEFLRMDQTMDEGVGSTLAERQARGKVKWNNGAMYVYIADK